MTHCMNLSRKYYVNVYVNMGVSLDFAITIAIIVHVNVNVHINADVHAKCDLFVNTANNFEIYNHINIDANVNFHV